MISEYGNQISSKQFNFELKPPPELELAASVDNESSQQIVLETTQEGFTIPELFVRAHKPGTYKVLIDAKNKEGVNAAIVNLNIKSSDVPTDLKILNEIKDSYEAGEQVGPFKVQVLRDDGKPTKGSTAIRLHVKDPDTHDTTFMSTPPPSQVESEDAIHSFKDSVITLTRAGTYTFSFELDISAFEAALVFMKKPLIRKRIKCSVRPGPAHMLEVGSPTFQLPAISNSSDDLDKRSFWEEVTVYAMDSYSNIVDDYSGELRIELKAIDSIPKKDWPQLEGDLNVKMKNGTAHFGRVNVKEGTGKKGMYKLCIICGSNIQPCELEFSFTDGIALYMRVFIAFRCIITRRTKSNQSRKGKPKKETRE